MKRVLHIAALFASISSLGMIVVAQDDPEPPRKPTMTNHLEPFAFFLGEWLGSGESFGEEATVKRSYRVVLDGNFVQAKTRAESRTDDGTPGEVREDWGMVSFDDARDTIIVREFHSEGFVNQYKVTSISEDGRRIVMETESVENGGDLRARLTIDILEENEFEETFELAADDEPFKVWATARLHRMMRGGH